MSGGATPNRVHAAVVGWAVLRHRSLPEGAVTIRWQRGHEVAYVLAGARAGDHGTELCLGTICVGRRGWVDLDQIRGTGQTWLRQQLAQAGAR